MNNANVLEKYASQIVRPNEKVIKVRPEQNKLCFIVISPGKSMQLNLSLVESAGISTQQVKVGFHCLGVSKLQDIIKALKSD